MNRKHFTLTELLMAIAIIVILAALAIPTSISAIKKAENAKAVSEMNTLMEALKNYETTYGAIPVKQLLGAIGQDDEVPRAEDNASDTAQESDTYTTLIQVLQGENKEISSKKLNPRKIKFLDVQENTEGVYLDPWGHKYFIVLDGDYDGKIKTKDIEIPGLPKNIILHQSIIIWSEGPDGNQKEVSDNLYSLPVLWDKDAELWQPETH